MSNLPHHLSGIALVCDASTELSAVDVSALTGLDVNRVMGLLGPTDVATVRVSHDYDTERPWNWESAPDRGAVIPDPRGEWLVEPALAHDAPEWIEPALVHYGMDVNSRYGWDDAAVNLFTRYARLHGYVVDLHTLPGQSQGDWLTVLSVRPSGTDYTGVEPWAEYWNEGGFYVRVDMTDTEWSDGVCVVGYDAVESVVADMLCEGITDRVAGIRAARSA